VAGASILGCEHFAFLISDVKMPGMTGIELAVRVHALPDAPLIILTSALEVDISDGIAEHFLPKPVDVSRLHGS
jgi:CheY-like chemotaxis protein